MAIGNAGKSAKMNENITNKLSDNRKSKCAKTPHHA